MKREFVGTPSKHKYHLLQVWMDDHSPLMMLVCLREHGCVHPQFELRRWRVSPFNIVQLLCQERCASWRVGEEAAMRAIFCVFY